MKRLIISLICVSITVFAQKPDTTLGLNFYRKSFNIGMGYHLGTGAGNFTKYNQNMSGKYLTYNPGTFGKGINIHMDYSYKIHPNLSLGLTFGLFSGIKNNVNNQFYTDSTNFTVLQESSHKANNVRVIPQVTFEAPLNKNNAIYCKLGYVLGTGKIKAFYDEKYLYANGNKSDANYEREVKGGVVHGAYFALGARAKIDQGVSFFIELSGYAVKQKLKEDNMIVAMSDGRSFLNSIDPYYTKTIYQDHVKTLDCDASPDVSKPREVMSYNALYNSVGLQVGFCFHIR